MVEVDVSRIALVAERAVEGSFARLNRYLAFAPISSEPDAPKTVGALPEALRADRPLAEQEATVRLFFEESGRVLRALSIEAPRPR